MFHMIARRRGMDQVTAGTDQAIWGLSLPRGTVLHDVKGTIAIHEETNMLRSELTGYAAELQVVPIPDPDAGTSFNTLWNQLVPKDTDAQVIDLDTVATDVTPFFEPGMTDWSQVLDIGKRPKKLYGRYKLLSMANGAVTIFRNDTNANVEYVAGDNFSVRSKEKLRADQPSVLMMAIASPDLLDTTITDTTMLAENEWSRIKYGKQMLEQAMISLIALEEAGAETPWEDQVDLLQEYLEPDLFEGVADRFVSGQFTVLFDFKIGISVTGSLSLKTLSTGR